MAIKQVNGIYKTMCPTFPRSGNTFLMLVLRDYFGADRFRFADIHRHQGRGFDNDPKCVFQKTHDFDLTTPAKAKYQYLVQIRHPIDALSSWQSLKEREGTMMLDPQTWWAQRMQYYADFIKRWVIRTIDHRLVLDYSDLMSNPLSRISGVIVFLTRDASSVDPEKLHHIINNRLRPTAHSHPAPFKRV